MNIPDYNRRLYQCFVCGKEFESYDEYKDHIVSKHEEGKDYVRCPLARCGAPVRDIRSHFKARHPRDPVPKACQMTALVWRDFQAKKRQRKPKFKEGWYPSTKMGKKFKFRSSWEETIYKCLDVWSDVLAFEAEPFKIPYLFQGESHSYIPDILIHFIDGHKEIWEIKPEKQKELEKNKAKWHSAREACKNRGWDFQVITEEDISKLKRKIRIELNEAINSNTDVQQEEDDGMPSNQPE